MNTISIPETPSTVYRVSIHNQIFSTTYYVVTKWEKAVNGGWKRVPGFRAGMRGKGNSLALDSITAVERATVWNRAEGWSKQMQILNSKGKVAFSLYA